MTAPSWQEDDPKNLSLIQGNAAQLITELRATAADRILPTRAELCRWHARLYAGCEVPVAGYVGHFRGDPAVKELIDYEVGLGARLQDGNLEKMGVWARQAGEEMDGVLAGLHAVFTELDARLPVGKTSDNPRRRTRPDQLYGARPRRMLTRSPLRQRQRPYCQAPCRLHLPAVRTADVPPYQAAAGE